MLWVLLGVNWWDGGVDTPDGPDARASIRAAEADEGYWVARPPFRGGQRQVGWPPRRGAWLGEIEVGGEDLAAVQRQEQREAAFGARRRPVVDVLVGRAVVAQARAAGRLRLQCIGRVTAQRAAGGRFE